jgi:hypothetical protein
MDGQIIYHEGSAHMIMKDKSHDTLSRARGSGKPVVEISPSSQVPNKSSDV